MKVLEKKKRPVFKFQQVCDILKIADYKEGLLWEKMWSFFPSLGTLWGRSDMFMLNIRVMSCVDSVSLTDGVPG